MGNSLRLNATEIVVLKIIQLIKALYTIKSNLDREKTQNKYNRFVLKMLDGKLRLLYL